MAEITISQVVIFEGKHCGVEGPLIRKSCDYEGLSEDLVVNACQKYRADLEGDPKLDDTPTEGRFLRCHECIEEYGEG